MLHATDCWVAQLGVPVASTFWVSRKAADTAAGSFRAQEVIPLNDIRPYIIDIGNNGKLSDSGEYWTTETDIDRLFRPLLSVQAPGKSVAMLSPARGLNDERAVAQRVIAYRDVCLANEIYPVHVVGNGLP
jgi:hypothetical protein